MHHDSVRLAWLEHKARNGGIYLYNGVDVEREKRTAVGIGLRPGTLDRTLREGIDAAMPKEWSAGITQDPIRVDEAGNVIDA